MAIFTNFAATLAKQPSAASLALRSKNFIARAATAFLLSCSYMTMEKYFHNSFSDVKRHKKCFSKKAFSSRERRTLECIALVMNTKLKQMEESSSSYLDILA